MIFQHKLGSAAALILGLFSAQSMAATLDVVGEGTAKWGIFTVYDATLYAEKEQPATYLKEGVPLALKLCYARSVKASDILKATDEAITKPPSAPLKAALTKLNRTIKSVDKGDCYQLTYGSGVTRLSLNQRQLIEVNEPGFKELYFGIWIGDHALSKSLKQDLLR
jgi:hypothetical protein